MNGSVQESRETRVEMSRIIDVINRYLGNDAEDRALLSITGLPGTGKSVLLQMTRDEIQNNGANEALFLCYADISDCADEIEVYAKIARELNKFFQNHQNEGTSIQRRTIGQFLKLYEWMYGKTGQMESVKSDGVVSSLSDIIEKYVPQVNNVAKQSGLFGENMLLAFDVLAEFADIMPFIRLGSEIVHVITEIPQAKEMKNLLQKANEALTNKAEREKLLCTLLEMALPGGISAQNRKSVIMLDNFQLETHNDLGRDHTWLTNKGKLMDGINALWIIASRSPVTQHFQETFRGYIYDEIELQGFSIETARNYLRNHCEDADETVRDAMLKICSWNNFHRDEVVHENAEQMYLPYLLDLLVKHYKKLKEDPNSVITAAMFASLTEEQEFVGYYFYKDMSDLMTNAFQILCCLPNWDETWTEVIRGRFDNHLLNAENQLKNTAPIENLGGGKVKLHEAIKDGLYNSSRNYIKYDVQKYLFEKFIDIYGSDASEPYSEIWYQSERMFTFQEIVHKYILSDTEHRKSRVNAIKGAMQKMYARNSARGKVGEGFIRFYARYIDMLKSCYEMPFLVMTNMNLSEETLPELQSQIVENLGCAQMEDKLEDSIYYMECCFKLADLYTYYNRSDEAMRLEELCLLFWEKMEEMYQEGTIEFWKCRELRIKALNAIAYDSSSEHDYEKAYQFGAEGLELFQSTATAMFEQYVSEEADAFSVLIAPEETEAFHIDECTEIIPELYKKLENMYVTLFRWGNEKQQEQSKKILSRLLLFHQQNLRGNFPWYCLKTKTHNAILQGDACWKFGARTYWMRRAITGAAKREKKSANTVKTYCEKMMTSYHNICAYLYKGGEIEKACIIEKEALEEGRKILPKEGTLEAKAEIRIEEIQQSIKKEETQDVMRYLWEKNVPKQESVNDYFMENKLSIEMMQYIGDYYLHLGFYTVAKRYFSEVALKRYICLGEMDTKTLDTIPRLWIAAVASYDIDLENLLVEFVTEKILKPVSEITMLDSAEGVMDKVRQLDEIKKIDSMDGDRTEKIRKMMEVIDE